MGLFDIVSILLVEDEQSVAGLIETTLHTNKPTGWPLRYNVKVASDLKSALRFIPGGGWDVIILDLGLPDSQGLGTFRQCNAVAKSPIIVLTGLTDFETIETVRGEGAYRCYGKSDITGCMRMLHHIINNVMIEFRRNNRIEVLQGALLEELRNLITECANCHRWRDPATNQYVAPKDFLEKHQIFLTHNFCPDCTSILYGDLKDG